MSRPSDSAQREPTGGNAFELRRKFRLRVSNSNKRFARRGTNARVTPRLMAVISLLS